MVHRPDFVLVTCEHGGNRVPAPYLGLFGGAAARQRPPLSTHLGFDAGALAVARDLAAAFEAPLVAATVTRLLVDLNRSVGHPRLHGPAVRALPAGQRQAIVVAHYLPHRSRVEALVQDAVAQERRVLHLASHSFTPVLAGKVRQADVGLLYDPARAGEAQLCRRWQAALTAALPGLRVRRNHPYAGKGDGLTRHLRGLHAPADYLGIEIEVNQALTLGAPRRFAQLRAGLIDALRTALAAADTRTAPSHPTPPSTLDP